MAGRDADPGTCARFELLHGAAAPPSNISILFGLRACDGAPLAGLPQDQFVLAEDGELVSAFESRRQIVHRGESTDMVALLLLDMSGSIIDSGSLPALQSAAKAFVSRITPSQRVGIYLFDGRAELSRLASFSRDTGALAAAIDSLSDYRVVDPSTNLNGAVVAGLRVLDAMVGEASEDGRQHASLVVFTDGADQAGRLPDQQTVEQVQKATHSVFAIGLGNEIDPEHLRAIGRSGFEAAGETEDIAEAFARTAERVEMESQRFYLLGFCSPKRSGSHVLSVSLSGRGGALTFSFDADQFTPGCDPEEMVSVPGPL